MKVRIRSGSQSGAVVELSQPEAESAIATGYAEAYVDPPAPEPDSEQEKPEAPEPRRRR